MKINSASFSISSPDVNKCPVTTIPEYAFIGRSNVGKSSLINMLTQRNKLAKISSTPGKTMLINHFIINKEWYLVDLPGYGFAKRSKTERAKWEKMINKYILNRTNLVNLFLLIDIRIEPQQIDLEFMDWLGISQIPFTIVFTKSDKLKLMQIKNNIDRYKSTLLQNWEDLPPIIITSSPSQKGRDEILNAIEITNLEFHNR